MEQRDATCPHCGKSIRLEKSREYDLTMCTVDSSIVYETRVTEDNIMGTEVMPFTRKLQLAQSTMQTEAPYIRYIHTCQQCQGQWVGQIKDPESCMFCRTRTWRGVDKRRRRNADRRPGVTEVE
jgi:hypothetical protein